ncbi:MAG TPA: family 43 glycosylhydrolase [Burkholderiaceae bacterium]|nr:family 43 glycosylhydrolase [Burkholderiaceae bacterium]
MTPPIPGRQGFHSLALAAALALGAGPGTAQAATYANPLVQQRADPSVYKHTDGYYYLTYSVPEYDRIAIRRATTLQGLGSAAEVVIWSRHASGEMSANIWAPWLDYVNGQWYVYFAAAQAGNAFNHRIYALSNGAANPVTASGWVEQGKIAMNWESFSIDATTFEQGGTRYMVWAQKDPAIEGNSNLYIAAMNGPLAISGTQVRLSRPEYDWERVNQHVNEAPAVLQHGGKVFISYSGSSVDANYRMGLLTAPATANLLDAASWSKSPTAVFESNEANGIYGPGSNTFTTDADGSTVNIYNARSYKSMAVDPLYDPNRATYAQVVNWNADGSPSFGVPTGSDTPMTLVNRHSGKCLDVQNPNLDNGANVGQYSCNGGNWQRWHLIDLGTGYYEIQSVNSGKVLDVSGGSTADGGNLIQYDWHGGANQQWQKVITTAPWFRLVNRASGKVLDVENCGAGDGVNVRQWTWLNNNCQQWQLLP